MALSFLALLAALAGLAAAQQPVYLGFELETIQLTTPFFGVTEGGNLRIAACSNFLLVGAPAVETDDLNSQGFGQVYLIRRFSNVATTWDNARKVAITSPFGNSRHFGSHVACAGIYFVVTDLEPSTGLPTYHSGSYDHTNNRWTWNGINMMHGYEPHLRGTLDTIQIRASPVNYGAAQEARVWTVVNNATAGEAYITWSGDILSDFVSGGTGNTTLVHGCTDGGVSVSAGGNFNVFTSYGTDCGALYVFRRVALTTTFLWQTSLQRSLPNGYGGAVVSDAVIATYNSGTTMFSCTVYVSNLAFQPTLRTYTLPFDAPLMNSDPNADLLWQTENVAFEPYGFGNGQGSGVGFGRLDLAQNTQQGYTVIIGSAAPSTLPGAQWLRVLGPPSHLAGGEGVNSYYPVVALDGMSVDCNLYATPDNPLVPLVGSQIDISTDGLMVVFTMCAPTGVPGARTSVLGLLTFTV